MNDSSTPQVVSPLRMEILQNLQKAPTQEQRTQAWQLLKERLSQIPSFAKKGEKGGDAYWQALSNSRAGMI